MLSQPVTSVNMLVVTCHFYTVIFMFHLPYMDVFFNLPISKIIYIYIYIYIYIATNKRLIFHMYMWIIFEISRLK